MFDGIVNHAGTGDADIDHGLRFADAVKSSSHEGIVFNGIRETDKLGAGDATLAAGALGGFLDDDAHLPHRVHVYSGARGRDIN